MDMSKIAVGLPKSRLTVNELMKLSNRDFFKKSIVERASKVGTLKYQGFKYTFHRDKDKKLVVYVNLYFYMRGAKTKRSRENYLLVAKFPYTRKVKNMKRLYDEPIQIFSSDPSFKFFFAYTLNRFNAVVTDDPVMLDHLGKALTTAPKQKNPEMMVQLTKHFYKFFQFIENNRPKEYMDKKYQIPSNTKVKVLNGNS